MVGTSREFFPSDIDTSIQGGTRVFAADMNKDGAVDVVATSYLPSNQLAWCVACAYRLTFADAEAPSYRMLAA